MIVVTTEQVEGRKIAEVLGMVRGNAVRARGIGYDFMAGIKNITGGAVSEYSSLLSDTREEATGQMIAEGEAVGADAIVATRYNTSSVGQGFSEIFAYGTAVKLKIDPSTLTGDQEDLNGMTWGREESVMLDHD